MLNSKVAGNVRFHLFEYHVQIINYLKYTSYKNIKIITQTDMVFIINIMLLFFLLLVLVSILIHYFVLFLPPPPPPPLHLKKIFTRIEWPHVLQHH